MKKKILIIGAGISGLTGAFALLEKGCRVTVVEKESAVGGLARSFSYGKRIFDIGPHRFYSSNPEVLDFLNRVGDDFISLERFSAVHFLGRYHTWPLRLKSVFQLPFPVAMGAFLDLFTKGRYKKLTDPNFKNFILTKYGKTLYETFFMDYTRKFLGLSPEDVHFHWAKIGVERATIDEKIKTGSIFQLFCLMLMPRPRQLNFLYPRGGCMQFTERLKDKIISMGGEILTGVHPDSMETENNRIKSVGLSNGSLETPDELIWTGSVIDLLGLMGHKNPGLSYLPLTVFNLELSEPPLKNHQWCYFGSRDVIFSRTTNPATFDAQSAPKGQGSICAEVTCPENSDFFENPERLKDRVIEDLVKTGSIRDKKIVTDLHMERIADTYPIYHRHYQEKLDTVKKIVTPVENLHLSGRTGLFWYNNMDHSIENAFETAEKAIRGPVGADEAKNAPFNMGALVGEPKEMSCVTE